MAASTPSLARAGRSALLMFVALGAAGGCNSSSQPLPAAAPLDATAPADSSTSPADRPVAPADSPVAPPDSALVVDVRSTSTAPDASPVEAGAPDPCSLPAETGPCDGAFTRYFYKPSSAKCEAFSYGGCRGNANNHLNKADCEMACEYRADWCNCQGSACPPVTDCSICPIDRSSSHKQACAVRGFSCVYLPSCGATTCSCEADPQGNLTWLCRPNLCRPAP